MRHAHRMTIPHHDDVRDESLTSDDQVLARAELLIERAERRQLWLMFLDAAERQLPLLMPMDVPRRPDPDFPEPFSRMLRDICEELDAESAVIAFERCGSATLADADRQWLTLVHTACRDAEIHLRGPLLVHDGGVRWIAVEDLDPVSA